MHAVTLGVNGFSDLNNTMTAPPPNPQPGMDPLQLQQLVQLLGKSAMPKQTAVVECPKTMVGRVIGKGGETIKSLQQYTGAMIQIDQSTDPTRVTIAGSPQSLQLAVSMVNDIVRGTFKGFAMLRQIAIACSQPGAGQYGQPQPIYVQGYGFVPPSQVFNPDEPLPPPMQHLSPTGPLTPPMTPMRANAAANNFAGGLSADAIAALLAGGGGGVQGQGLQGQMTPPMGVGGMSLGSGSEFSAGGSQEALISHLLSQVAAQQQQQQQHVAAAAAIQQSLSSGGIPDISGLDQATIQTMLAHAGLMGAGQAVAAASATPGMAQSLGNQPGLPPATSLMLSAQGTPAVLGSTTTNGTGSRSPLGGASSPLPGTGAGTPGVLAGGSTSPLSSFMGQPSQQQQQQQQHNLSSFLGSSPPPSNDSNRASPTIGSSIRGGLQSAAQAGLSFNPHRPTSGDSSPLGRYGAIGSGSGVSHIGAAAEDALAARLRNISTSDVVGGGVLTASNNNNNANGNGGGFGGEVGDKSDPVNNKGLLPGWVKVSDPQGLVYYMNTITKETSFLPPTLNVSQGEFLGRGGPASS